MDMVQKMSVTHSKEGTNKQYRNENGGKVTEMIDTNMVIKESYEKFLLKHTSQN